VQTFDAAHNLLTKTATGAGADPSDAAATSLLIESRSYDPAGRLATVTDALNRTTSYTYYQNNLLHTVTAHMGPPGPAGRDAVVGDRTYDAAAPLTVEVPAGGITTTRGYDAAGHTATQTLDPTGLNRVTATFYKKDGTVDHTTVSVNGTGRTER